MLLKTNNSHITTIFTRLSFKGATWSSKTLVWNLTEVTKNLGRIFIFYRVSIFLQVQNQGWGKALLMQFFWACTCLVICLVIWHQTSAFVLRREERLSWGCVHSDLAAQCNFGAHFGMKLCFTKHLLFMLRLASFSLSHIFPSTAVCIKIQVSNMIKEES